MDEVRGVERSKRSHSKHSSAYYTSDGDASDIDLDDIDYLDVDVGDSNGFIPTRRPVEWEALHDRNNQLIPYRRRKSSYSSASDQFQKLGTPRNDI